MERAARELGRTGKCVVPQGRWIVLQGKWRDVQNQFTTRRTAYPTRKTSALTSPFSRKTKRKTSFDKADKGLPGRLLVRLLVVQAMEHQNYLKNYFLAYCASHID